MTELGVYILGACALCILAAAGISSANDFATAMAIVSSGAAYLSQLGAANYVATGSGVIARAVNAIGMVVALGAWLAGTVSLI